ncbi:hypothetical protein TRFO_40497 [Tritrichomonas foetus]|uniref:Importin N-terminal domain-containing protein n=1 Tax=Tritrichomonas foetus TaxID=1144522 RepID=A0A1J4J7M1_9EUKA|nr:hypothetical protein TRFO_40497 [Tritrichomonas foetus]|eukprot:OHS93212.1 hypothetical protein TRFO_40497 [Tritrichomonas foetus]
MNSDFASQLAEALRGATSGNNDVMQNCLKIIEQMKTQPIEYCNSILTIIKNDTGLRTIALIEFTNLINSNIDKFPADFISFISNEFHQLYSGIDDSNQLRILVPSFVKILKIVGNNDQINLNQILQPNPNKLSFQIKLIELILEETTVFIDFILENIPNLLSITTIGLQQADWEIKLNCIRIITLLAGLDPESTATQVDIIISLISQSPELPEQFFLGLWVEFSALVEIVELSQPQIQSTFAAAIQSLSSPNLSIDSKIQALSVISLFPLFDLSTILQILDHSFNMLLEKAQNGELLDSVPDLFLKALDSFDKKTIYDFIKNKISSAMNSSPEAVGASLFIMKSLTKKLETFIKSDWPLFQQLIQAASKVDNHILLEANLMFISSLDFSFERQILESDLFVDIIVPLMVYPKTEVRHHARDAMYNMINSVNVPISGIVEKIWAINSQITTDKAEYLTLLAKAVEQEGENFETEKSLSMSPMLIQFLNSNDEEMIIGALSITTTLLLTNEAVHEVLMKPTIDVINNLLSSELLELQLNGLKRMSSLLPVFNFPEETFQKVMMFIQSNNNLIVEQAVDCVVEFIKKIKAYNLIGMVIPKFQEWIKNEDDEYFTVAVTAFQKLASLLNSNKETLELLPQTVNLICEISSNTKDEEIASDSFDAIASIISQITNPQVAEITTNYANAFINGKFKICNQKIPLECNFKSETLDSFINLVCELLRYDSDFNRMIFQFASSLIMTQDEGNIDLALIIFGDGIKHGGFNTQETTFIISYLKNLLSPQTNIDLIHSISYVYLWTIEKNIISEEAIHVIYPIFIGWWQNLFRIKGTMRPTLSNMAVLFWTIALKFNQFVPEIINQSFELFPPEDTEDIIKMSSMLIQMMNGQLAQLFSVPIAVSIAKILAMPNMILQRKGINKELVDQLGGVLKVVIKNDPNALESIKGIVSSSIMAQRNFANYLGVSM